MLFFEEVSTYMLQCVCFLAPTQAPVSLVAPTVPPSHGRKFANIVVLAFICICLDLYLVLLIFSDVSELKV